MHIKSRWNKNAKAQSLEDIAGALSFISWKIATNGVLELENRGYQSESNAHRLQIIAEFLALLLQTADRLAYEQMADEERQRFITALAQQMVNTFADNQREVLGEGDHKKNFIELLNQRADNYATLSFQNGEAGFDFRRYFGEQVATLLKNETFVSQQVMEVEAPEAIKTLAKGMRQLFEQRQRVG